jgi:hypothetical protein
MQIRVGLRNSDRAHCEASGYEQMGDDAFHGVSPVGRRVSHEFNVRNVRLTSIDELLPVDVSRNRCEPVVASPLHEAEILTRQGFDGGFISLRHGHDRASFLGACNCALHLCNSSHISPASRFKSGEQNKSGRQGARFKTTIPLCR